MPSHCGKFQSTITYFFSILTDCSYNAPSNPYRYWVWSACTCLWGHAKNAVAGRMGLTRATFNCILQRHAAIGTLVPGKSKGDPLKATRRQDHALFGMVWQDRFTSARALTAWIRNLYGMRAGRKTINNQFLSHSYRVYGPTRKPCWLPTSANLPQ